MEGKGVRSLYGLGSDCVVPLRALHIVAIFFMQIRFALHTIGRGHPWRLALNAANVEEQGDDHCEYETSQCFASWKRTFRSAHEGKTHTSPSAARVGLDGGDRNGG